MERNEFIETTQRLCDLYGKNLNETQAEFWYTSLQNFESRHYKMAIGEYARKNKYMPTISDLLSEIKQIKEREATQKHQEQNQQNQPKVPCYKCGGTGLVKYIKDGYDYLCICDCKNGERLDYPQLLKFRDVFPHVANQMVYREKEKTTPTPAPASTIEIVPPLNYDLTQIKF